MEGPGVGRRLLDNRNAKANKQTNHNVDLLRRKRIGEAVYLYERNRVDETAEDPGRGEVLMLAKSSPDGQLKLLLFRWIRQGRQAYGEIICGRGAVHEGLSSGVCASCPWGRSYPKPRHRRESSVENGFVACILYRWTGPHRPTSRGSQCARVSWPRYAKPGLGVRP